MTEEIKKPTYYELHKEQMKAYSREYNNKHKVQNAKKYQDNKAEIHAKNKEYMKNYMKEYMKKYYRNNAKYRES